MTRPSFPCALGAVIAGLTLAACGGGGGGSGGGGGGEGGGNAPPAGGSASAGNGCTMAASAALTTGTRYTVSSTTTSYAANGSVIGSSQQQQDVVVDGPATFAGQTAVRSTGRSRTTGAGYTTDAVVRSYEQVGPDELARILGYESEFVQGGATTAMRTTYNPPLLNSEFALALGQSMVKTEHTTTERLSPAGPTTQGSVTDTFTYEARETITVRGRSYDTCRYRGVRSGGTTVALTWHIRGKGFMALQEVREGSGPVVQRTELVSGTLNGAAL